MLTHMNVNSPNTTSVHEIAIFSPSVWCSQLVQWLQEKFCMKMWRRRSVPLIVLSLCLNFYFAAGIFLILKPRGVLLFELLLLWVLTPPWGSGDLGGKVLLGFLGCADCDVLNARSLWSDVLRADLRAGLRCSSSRRDSIERAGQTQD